jgi:cellulose synthase/poly-beta-1,6-N-acetylglucosamine synthase-like glycosyltransferase
VVGDVIDWGGLAASGLVRLEIVILGYFLLVNSFYAVLLVSAVLEMVQHLRVTWLEGRWRVLNSRVAPTITVLAPAHDEAPTIAASVRALLALYYPNLEVIIVNDGSTDPTLDVLRREFDLIPVHPIFQRRLVTEPVRGLYRSPSHPSLLVVDKDNGGKADALNAGLNVASGDLVCAIDADTLVEPDALQRMVRPFLISGEIVAAGGTIRVANGCVIRGGRVVVARVPRRPLPGFQAVEYLRAFLFGRLGWNRMGGNLIISGAFGLFRRDAVIASGGYEHGTVGEDMELVLRLRRRGVELHGPSQVKFIPDPVAWTQVPDSPRVLARQRDRWHRGLADTMWRHRRLFFNPRYGAMGMIAMPYFVIVELFAPVVEAVGLAGLALGLLTRAVNLPFAAMFFLVAYGYGLILTLATVLLEEFSFHRYASAGDHAVLVGWALLENFGYRQATVVWRLRGLIKYLRGRKDWGAMERKGFSP